LFEAIEELENDWRLDIGQREARRFLTDEALQELEEQPECISITGHGFWTDSSMHNQMLGEEELQKRSEQGRS
jgi:hypothetical protein